MLACSEVLRRQLQQYTVPRAAPNTSLVFTIDYTAPDSYVTPKQAETFALAVDWIVERHESLSKEWFTLRRMSANNYDYWAPSRWAGKKPQNMKNSTDEIDQQLVALLKHQGYTTRAARGRQQVRNYACYNYCFWGGTSTNITVCTAFTAYTAYTAYRWMMTPTGAMMVAMAASMMMQLLVTSCHSTFIRPRTSP